MIGQNLAEIQFENLESEGKILSKSPLKFLAMHITNQKIRFDIQVHLNKLESGGKVHLLNCE